MKRVFLHLAESVDINMYGLCIAVGMVICLWFMQRHPLYKKLNIDPYFSDIFIIGFLSALIGGRALYCLEMDDMTFVDTLAFWQGGFSVLGSVIGFCLVVPSYLIKRKIPLLSFFDLMALHAPLLQSLSRIGCFFAGCCYGKATDLWCGITYYDTESMAPLYIKIHPTQLYSAIALLLIFALQYLVLQKIFKKSGQMTAFYLMAMSAERFFMDYLRAGGTYYENYMNFSVTQSISAAIFISGLLLFLWTTLRNAD